MSSKEKKNVLSIDEFNLDVEWQKHPNLARKYLDLLADASLDLEEEEAQLKLVNAQLDRKIRKKPERYGVDKPTDKPIEQAIILQGEFQEQQKKVRVARHKVNLLRGMTQCMVDRRRALENMVELHGQDYFAEPRVSKKGKDKLADLDERSRTRRAQKSFTKRKQKDEDDD